MTTQSGDHLSDQVSGDLIEEFQGMVEKQFAKKSIMRQYTNVQPVVGTDTLMNRRVGRTTLKKVQAGVPPEPSQTKFGKASVTVDTIVLARDNQSKLNEFQADINVRALMAEDHGKEIGKFFDQALLIIAIKGAAMSAPSNLNGAIGAGKEVVLVGTNPDLDPDKLVAAIESILVQMEEEDQDLSELVVFVRPTHHKVLTDHDKLVSKEFSSNNGDYAMGTVGTIMSVPVVSTARIPKDPITNHHLSNADNANAYDVSATEAKTVAVIMHARSLLAGETIPLTSDIYYEKKELQWYIDSYIAFAAAVNRPDICGRVRKP